jgi:hypothetical protein
MRPGAWLGVGRSRWGAVLAAAVVLVAVTGCGISAEDQPHPVGSALPAAQGNDRSVDRPSPTGATDASELVDRYLMAAVGGGDEAVEALQRFMTPRLRGSWKPASPQLTIIRVLERRRELAVGDMTPLTVRYQPVAVLTEQGVVEDVPDQRVVTTTFNVVPLDPNSSQLRIDTAPHSLLISDAAFSDKAATPYYRAQPIYFWDRTNRWLVPDLRYLPLTLRVDQRPDQLVQWLRAGPSSWLQPAVNPLSNRTVLKTPVVSRDGVLIVNLSAQAAVDKDSLQRLVYQLQWSLRTNSVAPAIELQIEGQPQDVQGASSTGDYLKFNATAMLGTAQRFDLKDRQVVADAGPAPGPLASGANKAVVAAAITTSGELGAFVHEAADGTMSVRVVGRAENKPVDQEVWLPGGFTTARPVWVPGSKNQLIVVSGGRLYAVTVTGNRTDITPDLFDGVQMVAVAPDGRRIAMVASGRAYVAALAFDGASVHIGDQRRSILPGQLVPSAVAWESQDRILVVGTTQGVGALWRVTDDGAVAENLSSSLRGTVPLDIVAHPTEPGSVAGGEVMLLTDHGAGPLTGQEFTVEGKTEPFYAVG